METLGHILKQLFGTKGYIYYKRMIDDYLKGNWNFDIKQLVEYKNVKFKTSYVFTSKGYRNVRTRVVKNSKRFEQEMIKYYHMHIVPIREIRNNLILARQAFIKRWGYITEGNQICQKAKYNCKNCPNFEHGCQISMRYTNNIPNLKRMTKILELIYGNLCTGVCKLQVKEGLKYL